MKLVIYKVRKSKGGYQVVEVRHNCTAFVFGGGKRQCKKFIRDNQNA